jgi:glycosyltransferase involved in cell wall biosynthesis
VTVSILIPCFNAEKWIAQAIESALAQTFPDKEVIVVDDGSTDSSVTLIKGFGDRIRWEAGPNRGGNPARNRLLELSTGKWLQYLDADDYLLPDKLSPQVAFVEQQAGVDILFGPVTLEFPSAGSPRRELLPIPEPHDPWILLGRWYLPQTGSPLWRARAIRDVGGWKPDQKSCQEHELYLRLLMAGKRFVYHDSNGAVYRQWSEQTLWKKDKPATRERRLEIEQRAEEFLRTKGELSPARLSAINQGRFECARSAWHDDRDQAMRAIAAIERSQPDFLPAGAAAPPSYQRLYRWLGFSNTERLADWRRRLSGGSAAA